MNSDVLKIKADKVMPNRGNHCLKVIVFPLSYDKYSFVMRDIIAQMGSGENGDW